MGYEIKQDAIDIAASIKQRDRKISKQIRKLWDTAPAELKKQSNHVARLRRLSALCLLLAFLPLVASQTPAQFASNLISFTTLIVMAGAFFAYIKARKRARELAPTAYEWLWERIDTDENVALFQAIYGIRSTADLFAPWIYTRSKIKTWFKKRTKKFIRNG